MINSDWLQVNDWIQAREVCIYSMGIWGFNQFILPFLGFSYSPHFILKIWPLQHYSNNRSCLFNSGEIPKGFDKLPLQRWSCKKLELWYSLLQHFLAYLSKNGHCSLAFLWGPSNLMSLMIVVSKRISWGVFVVVVVWVLKGCEVLVSVVALIMSWS